MDLSVSLIIVVVIYCILYFFDTFFKTCAHYPYIQFLKGTGLTIKFFTINWSTTVFNRTLLRWGSARSKFFTIWFNLGLYACLLLLPIAICVLLVAFVRNFVPVKGEESVLQPIIPGMNLPASEIGYYAVTLTICSVLHELGHALAAVREDIHIIDVGVVVCFILPVAYVNFASDRLNLIEPFRQLKVFCAGIWHNLVITLVVYLLYLSLPSMFSYFFYVGNGISVYHGLKTSPLLGPRGLNIGDIIVKINNCPVRDDVSYFDCLANHQPPGFCINTDVIHQLDESIPLQHLPNGDLECCDNKRKQNLCFELIDNNDGIIETPTHVCLPGRRVIEGAEDFCFSQKYLCKQNHHCYKPVLSNNTSLFKIQRLHKSDVIYIGKTSDFGSILISPYVPKHFFSDVTIPEVVTKMLIYVTICSLGLALVNIIPCMFMDGQHITNILCYIILSKHLDSDSVRLISFIITFIFTILLVSHCFYQACLIIFY